MISYWKIFRVVFVIFFLYLMRDAFYRWDGVSYYASFSEFIPGVALISILWCIVAILISLLIWLIFGSIKSLSKALNIPIKTIHFNMFICVFLLCGAVIWHGKRMLFGYGSTLQEKTAVFISVILLAIFITWLMRDKNERIHQLIDIQVQITPLVWLFSLFVMISIFIVPWTLWSKTSNDKWDLLQKKRSIFVKKSPDDLLQKTPQSAHANIRRPNIILLTYDALTARNMSAYGYYRNTTPFIEKWARNATLFNRVEAESNHSSSTLATLMTGNKTWTHKRFQQEIGTKLIKNDISSLPLLLKRNGYFNMAFVSNALGDPYILGLSDSFDVAPPSSEFRVHTYLQGYIKKMFYELFNGKILLFDWFYRDDFILFKYAPARFKSLTKTEFPPEIAFNKFFDFYDGNTPEPFFVWIHVMPPHDPYVPPEPYMGMFNPSDKYRTAMEYEKFTKQKHKFLSKFEYMRTMQSFPKEMQPSIDILLDRYDEFIRYCDKTFEDFISNLEKRQLLDNSVVILSADHGESFKLRYLEHGFAHLYEQVTHIPLLIKEPGQNEGRIVNEIIEQVDIPSTMLDLAHIPVPSQMEGRSFQPLMRGDTIPEKPAYSMVLINNPSEAKITDGTIAVWEGSYKLIHYLTEDETLLYNLKTDPEEENNLFKLESEVASHLLNLIYDKLRKLNES